MVFENGLLFFEELNDQVYYNYHFKEHNKMKKLDNEYQLSSHYNLILVDFSNGLFLLNALGIFCSILMIIFEFILNNQILSKLIPLNLPN